MPRKSHKMKFNLATFLLDLAQIAPPLIAGILALKNEVPGVSRTQLASDSLKLATGVTAALGHNDAAVVSDAQGASSIIDSVIQTIAKSTEQPVT